MKATSISARARQLGLAVCLAASVAGGGCAQFAKTPAPFPLEWLGVETVPRPSSPVAEGLRNHKIKIERFVDKRTDPAKIGVVQKDNEKVRTSSDVAEFCTIKFAAILKRLGADVVSSGATMVLKPELEVFEVLEGGTFNGEAVIRVTAVEDGEVVYEGTHAGQSKRWGRSRHPDNYNEALSLALLKATHQLLIDDLFAEALGAATSGSKSETP